MDSIGGFRLVRRLGSGTRADVYLGRPIASGDDASTVAIKVFRPTTAAPSIDDEIEALARCSSRFLARLEDLTMAPDGRPALILGRVGPVTLSDLCLRRYSIGQGEAVTALAPVAEAVGELHRVGVAHGKLRLSAVHFDDVGAPVIIGFGCARIVGPIPTHGVRSDAKDAVLSPAARRDVEDLRAMARTVLESTPPSSSRSELVDWLADDGILSATFCTALQNRLFEFALPTPIRTADSAGSTRSSPTAVPEPARSDAAPTSASRLIDLLHLPPWLEELITGLRAPGRRDHPRDDVLGASTTPDSELTPPTLAERTRAFIAPVRRPVWIGSGLIVAVLVAAITTLGIGDDKSADAASERASAGVQDGGPRPMSSDEVSTPRQDETPAAPDVPQASAEQGAASAVEGADPVPAVAALVAERNRCFEARSILCLDGVNQPSSAAMDADLHALAAGDPTNTAGDPDGGTRGTNPMDQPDLTTGVPELAEELGGSAIVMLRFPAEENAEPRPAVTVLVVRGESGWRIRDLVFE